MATVLGYLQSIGEWDPQEDELGYDWDGTPQYPTWDYAETPIIGIQDFPAIPFNKAPEVEPSLETLYEAAKEVHQKYLNFIETTEVPTEPLVGAELLELEAALWIFLMTSGDINYTAAIQARWTS